MEARVAHASQDRAGKPVRGAQPGDRAGVDFPIVLFDGACAFCDASVLFVLDRERGEALRFASLQSDLGASLVEAHHLADVGLDSMILIEDGVASVRSTAGLRIAGKLRFPWRLAWVFLIVPRFVRDGVYAWIARNRYRWFGKKEACRIPDSRWRARLLG